jgi:hypothetical protein
MAFFNAVKFMLLFITTASVVYATFLLHRVVEDGRSIMVYMPSRELSGPPTDVRIVNGYGDPITVKGFVGVLDSKPLRVETIGPVEVIGNVDVGSRVPLKVEIKQISPIEVRAVR